MLLRSLARRFVFMQVMVFVFLMLVVGVAARAQSDAGGSATVPGAKSKPPASVMSDPDPTTPGEIRARRGEWLTQCLRSWDSATTMTRQEWERTCRRVTDDRVEFLLKQAKEKKVP
jgi:hypothetical protein